jgi:hypothetical protein
MCQQQHRLLRCAFDEVAEQLHHIVVAGHAVGCRATHSRQVRVDPPVSRRGNDGLDCRLDFAVVDTGPVQSDQRHTSAVFDVLDRDFVDLALHVGTVVVGTDNAEGARMASEDGTADVLP